MTASATVIANGAVGLTGLTRAEIVATLEAATTSVDVVFPNTFIPIGIVNTIAKASDGTPITPAIWYDSTNSKWVLKLSAAAGAGTYKFIVIGELGRRDFAPRTAANYTSENPNYAGNP